MNRAIFQLFISSLAPNSSIKRSTCDIHYFILVMSPPLKKIPWTLHLSSLFLVFSMLTVYRPDTLFSRLERLLCHDHPRCVSLFYYHFNPNPESKLCCVHIHTVYHSFPLIKHHGTCPYFLRHPGFIVLIVTNHCPYICL